MWRAPAVKDSTGAELLPILPLIVPIVYVYVNVNQAAFKARTRANLPRPDNPGQPRTDGPRKAR